MLISRCFFLTAFFVSFGVKASTICVGHYVGNNVGFTSSFVGDQFNKVNIKTHGRWNGGGQDSLYKSLRDFAGFSSYSVAVPKKIPLPGSSVQLAYFHERRSLNNFHRDRVITFEQIAE